MSGIHTVAADYDKDYHAVLEGRMAKEDFCFTYGHLRAGTYNIRSPRYDQMDKLFMDNEKSQRIIDNAIIDCDEIIQKALDKAIIDVGFENVSGEEVLHFIKTATEQREYFKFIFTKSLSYAIELIKQVGNIAKIDINDLSYLELPEIYASEYYSDVERLHEFWSLIINKRRELFKINAEMILPEVITSEQDFGYIENIDSRPNYITESIITGEIIVLRDETFQSIDGKIVVIEKADPGFDWIFSKGIAGLITKYGGAASHMAIRCAEFKIPAAIGSGSKLYEYAAESKQIMIDCMHERIIRME